MSSRKNVLTTGEVARICNVAPRTVSKWFDSGQLRGYRIPGSKDRRIPLNQLLRFMRAHGIPLENVEQGAKRILIIDADREFGIALAQALECDNNYEVMVTGSAFEAGATAMEMKPHALVVDVDLPDITARSVAKCVRVLSDLRETCLIGIGKELTLARGQALLQDGFDSFLSKPFEVRALMRLMEDYWNDQGQEETAAVSSRGSEDIV